jgi:2-polyprenyl-6-methoxyphenol hydroxylase-like FAD-dependent oxidoreductase
MAYDKRKDRLICMTPEEKDQQNDLSNEELEAQDASELPDRENMSLINANIAIPVNAAVAANVLSDGATAYADAAQTTPITQGN